MSKAKVIAIMNQKGGSSKTMISINVAVGLIHRGYRVLLMDADGQGSAMDWYSIRTANFKNDEKLLTVLRPERDKFEDEFHSKKNDCDFIIIDGKPTMNTINKFAASISDITIVPLEPNYGEITKSLQLISILPPGSPVHVLYSKYVSGNLVHYQQYEPLLRDLEAKGNFKIMDSIIHNRVVYYDCESTGRGVLELHNKSAKDDMNLLCDEILEKTAGALV